MKTEREQITNVHSSRENELTEVNTRLSTLRRTLHFNFEDASREKENQMYRELGKTGLSLGAFTAAGLYGVNQVIEGFNNSNNLEIGNGAVIVLLTSFILPLTKRFYGEARVLRREKKAIDKSKKSL